jgi:hypothetical protein
VEVSADILSLLKTLEVLQSYLREIVIVGGWVPLLYRKYGQMPSRHPSVRTMDIDIAVPRRLEEQGRPTIDELLSSAGYKIHLSGSDIPITKYELANPPTNIEFLTSEVGRSGKAAIPVQRGLTVQALRYIEILLQNTREIEINDVVSGSDISLVIRVPSPSAFIYQKGLTLPYRHSKVSKDLYYIFDLLDSPKERDSISVEINSFQSQYPAKWFHRFIRNLNKYFPELGAEGPALLATQYSGSMSTEIFRNYAHRTFRNFIQSLS